MDQLVRARSHNPKDPDKLGQHRSDTFKRPSQAELFTVSSKLSLNHRFLQTYFIAPLPRGGGYCGTTSSSLSNPSVAQIVRSASKTVLLLASK
jgi:hypothetical protein